MEVILDMFSIPRLIPLILTEVVQPCFANQDEVIPFLCRLTEGHQRFYLFQTWLMQRTLLWYQQKAADTKRCCQALNREVLTSHLSSLPFTGLRLISLPWSAPYEPDCCWRSSGRPLIIINISTTDWPFAVWAPQHPPLNNRNNLNKSVKKKPNYQRFKVLDLTSIILFNYCKSFSIFEESFCFMKLCLLSYLKGQ